MKFSLAKLCLSLAYIGFCGGCSGSQSSTNPFDATSLSLRIYRNPYAAVDWENDLRLKGQHHDHIRTDEAKMLAYDRAGYHAISAFDYSGTPQVASSLNTRLWPIETALRPEFVASLENLKVWFPSAEEAGIDQTHVVSVFLDSYIERWDPTKSSTKQVWQYQTKDELFHLVRSRGGLPVLAHPWNTDQRYAHQQGLFGAEIYSAFAEARRRQGIAEFVEVDRNAVLLQNWDRALAANQSIVGFSVNDHFGPVPDLPVTDDVRDSGKVIVMTKALTLEAYRDAIERGALFAIRDFGSPKDQFPHIRAILVNQEAVVIETDSEVRWIAMGREVPAGSNVLPFSLIPEGSTYVRAEVHNSDRSVVYTQAFWVRPIGDANGDNVVDAEDELICSHVASGQELDPEIVSACEHAEREPSIPPTS